MLGPPAWRALPRDVQRRVVRDARRGLPPPEDAVARAAGEWADWAHRLTGRAFGLAAVALVAGLAVAAATGPWVLFGLAGLPFTMVVLLLSRRDASRIRAVARRPRDG